MFLRENRARRHIVVAPYTDTTLFCALSLREHDDSSKGLIVGYSYSMMKAFAEADSLDMDIRVRADSLSWEDSLKQAAWDLAVIAIEQATRRDSIIYSHPLDSLTVCAAALHRRDAINAINSWLPKKYEEKGHSSSVHRFLKPYNPVIASLRGRTFAYISPYDDIIRKYSGRLGWDWRMLAALIFQESHFDIDAHSQVGAHGLMQLMPATADKYGVRNTLDPEDCIRAGVEQLVSLQRYFAGKADNAAEHHKMVLAAYNSGPGHIQDCINYANYLDRPSGSWQALLDILPLLSEEEVENIDTVKCGRFKGVETVAFVENILSFYKTFCEVCPGSDTTAAPFGLLNYSHADSTGITSGIMEDGSADSTAVFFLKTDTAYSEPTGNTSSADSTLFSKKE